MPASQVQDNTVIILFIAATAGLSAAAVAWLVSKVLVEVPAENRTYKDDPPLGFRLLWWPIHWISHFIAPLLSASAQGKALLRLRRGGLEYALAPAQFIAARLVCALAVATLFWWGLGSLDHAGENGSTFGLDRYLYAAGAGASCGYAYPSIWLRDLLLRRKSELLKALPFYLDIITLCVEAGLNMQGALNQAVVKGPKGVLREEFQRVLRDIRAGRPRAEALRGCAERLAEPSIGNFVTAVIQAENMGMNLGPVLRAQADQRRTERFLRAEKLAMQAPVKMLFPLIAFIFPCTFIVLFFPIVMKFIHSGL